VSDTKGVANTLRRQEKRGEFFDIPTLEDLANDGTPLTKVSDEPKRVDSTVCAKKT